MRFRSRNDLTTPKHFIDILAEHFGPIDMDPCSNPWSVVGAKYFLSPDQGQDGLSHSWNRIGDWWVPTSISGSSHIYINPPWGRGELRKWVRRIEVELTGNLIHKPCISLLVPLCPTAKWCHELYALKPHIFALKKRLVYGGETVTNSRADQLCLLGPWPTERVQSLALSGHFWYLGYP